MKVKIPLDDAHTGLNRLLRFAEDNKERHYYARAAQHLKRAARSIMAYEASIERAMHYRRIKKKMIPPGSKFIAPKRLT